MVPFTLLPFTFLLLARRGILINLSMSLLFLTPNSKTFPSIDIVGGFAMNGDDDEWLPDKPKQTGRKRANPYKMNRERSFTLWL